MATSFAHKRLVSAAFSSRCLHSLSATTISTSCYSSAHATLRQSKSGDNSKTVSCFSDDFSFLFPDRAKIVWCRPSMNPHLFLRSYPSKGFAFRPSVGPGSRKSCGILRHFSHGSVSLIISPEGHPKFETNEIEPPKKEKWTTKKRFKLQKKREKQKRKAANKRDPRRLGVKGKKKNQKFATAEERIKDKLEKAKIKESLLIERLKRYEVAKVQGPVVKPHDLTGEERFYMKKMAQKRSNYVPIGRRGIFGGVILNMHMHWKKHETVKVISNSSKPGQIQEFAQDIARLSGGIPIQVIGNDTVVFYRGKDYVQPQIMSPIDTLSKKRALEKSKYEQSLESVRRFIAIAEKELELYYRHVALYGDPNNRNPLSILDNPRRQWEQSRVEFTEKDDRCDGRLSDSKEVRMADQETSEEEDEDELSDFDDDFEDDDDGIGEVK